MTTIQRLTLAAATGVMVLAGAAACSHGSVDVRGYDYGYNPDGYAEVDIVGSDGFRHHGYYDRDRSWHGGWYDRDNHFHADRVDWHR